ncbi:GGDEF domain-containing protein [Shewanella sp. CG12_big_fil_rev_8_21_14_0_65_47_15]|uniref:GGDEF domain-containing protein n=1 Tax=Shewanella sp. CG12_big_fil_rev_8_21_14_0_65_47_15 TaxID=1975537 RepID=UPI000CC85A23|nr:GGDEF domain-containing protein [Shewanella sp. CG12_big_fil_rev_8_21_14_0_65_47_15]PIW61699.1 MAG: GGDEF domain-containing protein [Shewanella sp. CG12_big_fil_rev_8_21_14_0_65_47_15]
MTFDPQALLLIKFICLLTGTAAIAWGLIAQPLKIAPKASMRFSLGNLFVLLGIILNTQRTEAANYFFWFWSDILILLGFLMLRWGTQYLFRLQHSTKFDIAALAITAVLMLLVPPDVSSERILASLFSANAALSFILLTKDNYLATKRDTGNRVATAMVLPLIAMAVVFIIRFFIALLSPEKAPIFIAMHTQAAIPVLWFYVFLALVINIVMIGNALTRLVSKIRILAERDQLTGLWNRRAMQKMLKNTHQRWLRNNEPYSMVLLDLDHFKDINDQYGHDAGDLALLTAARLFGTVLRENDALCRHGGEEFLVLLPATDAPSARIVADKLHKILRENPLHWQGREINLYASLGYATIYHGCQPDQLLIQADQAMYHAKLAGRDRICQANIIE